ncbi:hypothetical protein INR49_014194 [Caranx melampygus]|nr:hypothetical protein INR49_014194 [Caranx melampygus]
MASENNDTNAGNEEEEAGHPSETNEHDYAHAAATNFTSTEAPTFSGPPADHSGATNQGGFSTAAEHGQNTPGQPSVSLTVELPEPAVGAEVDCPAGNYVGASTLPPPPPPHSQTEDDLQKAAASEVSASIVAPGRGGGRRRTKRPEDKNCAGCKIEFERQGRRFNRRAVYTFTTPDTVHWVFPESAVNDKSFLCETCVQVIRSKGKRKQTGKRRFLWLKPPDTKQTNAKAKKKKGRRMGKKGKAALLVSKSCYKSAFKMLWSAKGARKPMLEFWTKQLKEEMKLLSRQGDSPFQQKVTSRKPLLSFPWRRNIWKNNFMQASLGAELRLQGCSGSALDALNTMGLCQNKDTVRLLTQRLQNGKRTKN